MDYLPESINDFINSEGPENVSKMIAIVAVKMLDVLENFHSLGYLHRDIKQ